jgi:hypothetical protein
LPDVAELVGEGDPPELHALSVKATAAVSAKSAAVVLFIDPPDVVIDLPDTCGAPE